MIRFPSHLCRLARGLVLAACLGVWTLGACSDAELSFSCPEEECAQGPLGPRDTGGDFRPADGSDAGSADGSDAADDTGGGEPSVEPGGFGAPCQTDEDCIDRFCIVGLTGDYICTERCADTCDAEGYACQLIQGSGADLVRICYPEIYDLCKPCTQDFECGGLADRCIPVQDGTFCGSDCSRTGECPEGFDCRSVETHQQCVPADGFCSACFDRDADGFGEGDGCLGTDCNDLDPFIFENAPELCDFKDNDCDNEIDEDIDTTTDPNHCGGCNQLCDLPNAVNICVAETCFIEECDPGFYDITDEPGCEYECKDEDLEFGDLPDRDFMDTDCDGIDGDAEQSVFVSASTGHPDGDGTREDPVDTIWGGIALAQSLGFSNVLVAEGTYTGESAAGGGFDPLILVEGISVHGAYDAITWERADDNLTLISGNVIGVQAQNIVESTVLSNVTVQADSGGQAPSGEGQTSIALLAVNASGLVIVDAVLEAGNGGEGDNGDDGDPGADAGDGGDGGVGHIHGSGLCCEQSAPARGTAGSSSCSVGGRGGTAGRGEGDGSTGEASGSVAGGPGGDGGDNGFLGYPSGGGDPGSPGCTVPRNPSHTWCASLSAPQDGANGSAGSAVGSVNPSGVWVPGHGGDGQQGSNGFGGGGGGGGGGASGDCSDSCPVGDVFSWCDGYGGAGGGGGGGGCGGRPAGGGFGGGGSVGLYLIDSEPTVIGSDLVARNGGRGGDGGRGGRGGFGGEAGRGGSTNCNGGRGGNGGDGTDGGSGGHGGGGAGGVSFAIFLVDSSDVHFTDDNVTLWGSGGPGGAGPGNAGNRGESGAVRRVSR